MRLLTPSRYPLLPHIGVSCFDSSYGPCLVAQTAKASACNAGRPGFDPRDREDSPGEGKWQPTPWRKSHGQRSVVGLQSRDRKEPDVTERPHWLTGGLCTPHGPTLAGSRGLKATQCILCRKKHKSPLAVEILRTQPSCCEKSKPHGETMCESTAPSCAPSSQPGSTPVI